MARATLFFLATTLCCGAAAVYLYVSNQRLEAQVATMSAVPAPPHQDQADPGAKSRASDPWQPGSGREAPSTRPPPALPAPAKESRMERRARRTADFAATWGRLEGETEEAYRARIGPKIEMMLALPRGHVAEMRRTAEAAAKITAQQSAALDQALETVYNEALTYTDQAIQAGQLSPYERNVAGWLEYAGGLGGILQNANTQIATILDADQARAMYDAGFEWSEYIGVFVPWERLRPPPPPK